MTNVLAALLVLNVYTQQVLQTNEVAISCAEAGCTNQVRYTVAVVDDPGYTCTFHQQQTWVFTPTNYPLWPSRTNDWKVVCECKLAKTHEEARMGCKVFHTRPVVWTNTTITVTVLGTEGKPMWDVVQIESHDCPVLNLEFWPIRSYIDGLYFWPHKENRQW